MPKGVYERKADKFPRKRPERAAVMCGVPGCGRVADRPKVALCETHYYRKRRHGSYELHRQRRAFYVGRHGYIKVTQPEHPLAHKGGCVLEHRKVYYDAHGAGPFQCHWCAKPIEWATLHIDHLNDTPGDNRLENLVPSCPPCNTTRGNHKSIAANQARGLNLTLNGVTLPAQLWADRLGISKVSLKARLAKGWSVARALTEPRGKYGPRGAR